MKTKVYIHDGFAMHSISELMELEKVEEKVKDCLDHRLIFGGHTIPEIAKDIGESEERVADALHSLCMAGHPKVLIASDEWEEWFQRFLDVKVAYPQPFTNETKFYTWVAR
jgi:hypothetical protein